MGEEYSMRDAAIYGGFIDDEVKLTQSASGGIATALSEYILAQGGYVAGVAYSPDYYKAEYVVIHDASELHKLKGSKYIDCDKKRVYADVKKLLEAGETVLFFGLPCVVAGLYTFLGARPENLLTCELVCHGPTDPKVHSDYVAFLERKYRSKVIGFSVRYKADTWTAPYLFAKFENGKTFKKPFIETEYSYAFYILGKPPCYCCRFKGSNHRGDIMIGDFWGAAETDPFWNKRGVSCIFAETAKGNAVLKAVPGIKLFPTTLERVTAENKMIVESRECSPKREVFAELLNKKGLFYAVRHTSGFVANAKRVILSIIPASVKPTVLRIVRRLKSKF